MKMIKLDWLWQRYRFLCFNYDTKTANQTAAPVLKTLPHQLVYMQLHKWTIMDLEHKS